MQIMNLSKDNKSYYFSQWRLFLTFEIHLHLSTYIHVPVQFDIFGFFNIRKLEPAKNIESAEKPYIWCSKWSYLHYEKNQEILPIPLIISGTIVFHLFMTFPYHYNSKISFLER